MWWSEQSKIFLTRKKPKKSNSNLDFYGSDFPKISKLFMRDGKVSMELKEFSSSDDDTCPHGRQ